MDTFLLVLRVGLSLTVVAVLLWMAQKRFAKAGHHGEKSAVDVIGRRNLGQKASVVVVESAGQRFLLGVTEHSVNVLHTSDAPEAAVWDGEPAEGTDPEFALVLQQAGEPGLRREAAARRPRHAPSPDSGPLHGTIFAPSTWAQAGAAVRKGLNL
ncbi:FliO/MopB family protein [Arthrobacter sp. ERGS1:01]|uniref:FliO/MopB family protein n=1 Tax=Arthrobacter sp. ERGS1:01 TaxID=1704044 RepID=UPI0006B686FD|nr:flagellar biosynthetic protein FliO [Arthrobacter sp. ERGS1:01]